MMGSSVYILSPIVFPEYQKDLKDIRDNRGLYKSLWALSSAQIYLNF